MFHGLNGPTTKAAYGDAQEQAQEGPFIAYEGNAMSVTLRWQARKLEFQLPFAKLEHTELVKMCNDD